MDAAARATRFPWRRAPTRRQPQAKGRYLLFMDDDNLALPGELETLVRAAETSESDVVTCAHEGFTDQGGAANAAEQTCR